MLLRKWHFPGFILALIVYRKHYKFIIYNFQTYENIWGSLYHVVPRKPSGIFGVLSLEIYEEKIRKIVMKSWWKPFILTYYFVSVNEKITRKEYLIWMSNLMALKCSYRGGTCDTWRYVRIVCCTDGHHPLYRKPK